MTATRSKGSSRETDQATSFFLPFLFPSFESALSPLSTRISYRPWLALIYDRETVGSSLAQCRCLSKNTFREMKDNLDLRYIWEYTGCPMLLDPRECVVQIWLKKQKKKRKRKREKKKLSNVRNVRFIEVSKKYCILCSNRSKPDTLYVEVRAFKYA